ncbi:MAG TPA: Uma2 family endonuclease [Terriglobia bacterium]|nr:Uma2 family endonuclease [Terriglobia bacterium]
MITRLKYTHADLLQMPDDGKRREIIDGDLYVTPLPIDRHQMILFNLTMAFGKFLEIHPLGKLRFAPLDVILGEHDVLEPDLLIVLNEHQHILQDWVRGAPDLVIEILSPTTAARDRGIKLKAYARYGVGEYWIVDPALEVIEVYRMTPEGFHLAATAAKGDTTETPLLPGFSLAVDSVFKP